MAKNTKQKAAEVFLAALPHAKDLGLSLSRVGDGEAVVEMPYHPGLVGDPSTGVLHGGAVSALIDTACGAAVLNHPENGGDTATLNLRIDYMRAAKPGAAVRAAAHCFHVTPTVAFVRAEALDDDPDHPVATAAAAFTFKRRSQE
ncbi:MAG: PaaI family thioesterase [Pseudomonadota bacterium]